ncbi:MAG: hypothetical protein Rubg2KO_18190 [Rubricoccaceae bacterium]
MSDTPTPPPEAPLASPSPSESASPKRPSTILGRLSKALREQNWFAVALELVIVVIGFQVTSWGQDRTDRSREQTYLNEIRRDLIETEASLQDAASRIGVTRDATSSLIRAAYDPDTTPRDSLALWLFEAQYIGIPAYRMGTARALVETGDLQLIRDDSTRITLSRLVDDFQRTQRIQQTLTELILPGLVGLRKRTATTGLYADLARLPAGSFQNNQASAFFEQHAQSLPENGRLSFSEDYADLLNDADAFRDWRDLSDHLTCLAGPVQPEPGECATDPRAGRGRSKRMSHTTEVIASSS